MDDRVKELRSYDHMGFVMVNDYVQKCNFSVFQL